MLGTFLRLFTHTYSLLLMPACMFGALLEPDSPARDAMERPVKNEETEARDIRLLRSFFSMMMMMIPCFPCVGILGMFRFDDFTRTGLLA